MEEKLELLYQAEDAISKLVNVLENEGKSEKYEARYILNRIIAFKSDIYAGGSDG